MKACPFCAEQIQDVAIKCRFCGSMLAQAEACVADANPPARHAVDAPAAVIFEGVPSWKAQFRGRALVVLLDVVGLAMLVVLPWKADVPWRTTVLAAGCCWGCSGLLLGYLALVRRALRYRITSRCIEVESGLLSRRIETMQLWKVRDLEFLQSLGDRVLGVARIRVLAHDATDPELVLWGLPASRVIYDKLKDAVELARNTRGVVNVVE